MNYLPKFELDNVTDWKPAKRDGLVNYPAKQSSQQRVSEFILEKEGVKSWDSWQNSNIFMKMAKTKSPDSNYLSIFEDVR